MDTNADAAAEAAAKQVAQSQGGTHLNYGSGDTNSVSKKQEAGVSKDD